MEITVGDLKRHLASYDDDDELIFQGGLTFYRLKRRGPKLVQLEFSEAEGYLSDNFKKKNPAVMAVFMKLPLQPGELVSGPYDVTIR